MKASISGRRVLSPCSRVISSTMTKPLRAGARRPTGRRCRVGFRRLRLSAPLGRQFSAIMSALSGRRTVANDVINRGGRQLRVQPGDGGSQPAFEQYVAGTRAARPGFARRDVRFVQHLPAELREVLQANLLDARLGDECLHCSSPSRLAASVADSARPASRSWRSALTSGTPSCCAAAAQQVS